MTLTVGDEFPDLELTDFRKNKFSLSDYRGDNNILLVFLPEGFGLPISRRLLRRLHQHSDQLVETKTSVIVVSQNSTKSFKQYWSEHGLDFVGIPDPAYTIAGSVAQLESWEGQHKLPPTIFVLDKQGMVRFLDYREVLFGKITIVDVLATIDP
jgi:peroxiredoxin